MGDNKDMVIFTAGGYTASASGHWYIGYFEGKINYDDGSFTMNVQSKDCTPCSNYSFHPGVSIDFSEGFGSLKIGGWRRHPFYTFIGNDEDDGSAKVLQAVLSICACDE